MSNGNWRGTVGMVKPTRGSGSLEEIIRMLPEGIKDYRRLAPP